MSHDGVPHARALSARVALLTTGVLALPAAGRLRRGVTTEAAWPPPHGHRRDRHVGRSPTAAPCAGRWTRCRRR